MLTRGNEMPAKWWAKRNATPLNLTLVVDVTRVKVALKVILEFQVVDIHNNVHLRLQPVF